MFLTRTIFSFFCYLETFHRPLAFLLLKHDLLDHSYDEVNMRTYHLVYVFLLLTSCKGTSKQEYLHAYIIIFTQKSLRRPASEALAYVYKCSCIRGQLNLVDLSRKSFMQQVPLLFRELYCQHFLRSLLSICCFLSA